MTWLRRGRQAPPQPVPNLSPGAGSQPPLSPTGGPPPSALNSEWDDRREELENFLEAGGSFRARLRHQTRVDSSELNPRGNRLGSRDAADSVTKSKSEMPGVSGDMTGWSDDSIEHRQSTILFGKTATDVPLHSPELDKARNGAGRSHSSRLPASQLSVDELTTSSDIPVGYRTSQYRSITESQGSGGSYLNVRQRVHERPQQYKHSYSSEQLERAEALRKFLAQAPQAPGKKKPKLRKAQTSGQLDGLERQELRGSRFSPVFAAVPDGPGDSTATDPMLEVQPQETSYEDSVAETEATDVRRGDSVQMIGTEQFNNWLANMPADFEISQVPPSIFRGVPVSRLLSQGPNLMQNVSFSDEEAEQTFQLSEPMNTDRIDTFLSHTWSSNRYLKYLAMLYHFNGLFSFIAAHVAAFCTFLLLAVIKFGTAQDLPVFYMPIPGNEEEAYKRGLPVCGPCFFVGCVVQIATFLFGHRAFCRSVSKTTIFLDKACIHQTDPVLKKEGISHVGGFVWQSRCMFVPWDDNYFERLWCTYEVAAFVRCKGSSTLNSLILTPIQVAVFVFCIAVIGFIGTSGFLFMIIVNDKVFTFWFPQKWFEYFLIWGTGGTLVFGVPKFIYCHFAVQSRWDLEEKLANFSVANAKVAVADDREFIEKCIRGWFGTLEAFDDVVKIMLPEIVRRSLGDARQGLRFVDVLQENAGVLFLLLYDATILKLPDPRGACLCIVMALSAHLVIDPLFLYSLNALARFALRMSCGTYTKHAVRAVGVFVLGLVYPGWFAFCWNCPLWAVAASSVCLGMIVPFIFKR